MATPPKMTRIAFTVTVERIARRRYKVDDPHVEELPDPDQAEAHDVLAYLRRHSGAWLPRWVLQADVCDALTLHVWQWWQDRRDELHWLKTGRSRGLYLTQMGTPLGITTRRGVQDRIDRLESLLRYDRPDEKVTREARRAAREAEAAKGTEQHWVDSRRGELRDLVAALAFEAQRHGVAGDEREWLDELAQDARDDMFTPATMVILGMAASEVRTAPSVLALPGPQPWRVHRVLAAADALCAAFAGLHSTEVRG